MQLVRLDVDHHELGELPVFVSDDARPVVLRVRDGDAVIALAAQGRDWEGSWGIWLRVDEGYAASMVARDVKTLSHLVTLDHVVLEADESVEEHATLVRALLGDEPVTMTTSVASVTNAYNRPAPPRPVTVWTARDGALRSPGALLRLVNTDGRTTTYQD